MPLNKEQVNFLATYALSDWDDYHRFMKQLLSEDRLQEEYEEAIDYYSAII